VILKVCFQKAGPQKLTVFEKLYYYRANSFRFHWYPKNRKRFCADVATSVFLFFSAHGFNTGQLIRHRCRGL
jgi:hypothetical protein